MAVDQLSRGLQTLGWVTDLLVAGSLAAGDYRIGVSDLDLVALTDGPVDAGREEALAALHRQLDSNVAAGANLGCLYVESDSLQDATCRHPTWTHGRLERRRLSGITRAELSRHGYAVFGREPGDVFPRVSDDDVRHATRDELTGYWALAVRRPWWWLDPSLSDLGMTTMARARHSLKTGNLMTKSEAIEMAEAPVWLRDQMRARCSSP